MMRLNARDAPVAGTKVSTAHLEITTYPSDSAVAPGNRLSIALDIQPHAGIGAAYVDARLAPHYYGTARPGEVTLVRVRVLIWILGLALLSQSGFAQPGGESSASTSPRIVRVAGWTVNGSLRLRFEDWDFFKAQQADNSYGYGASLLRVSAGRQFRSHDWLFELAVPWLIGLPAHAIAPAPQGQLGFGATYYAANPDRTAGIFLKQAFV